MSYQVLARKWRPRSFADMVGQGHVLKALANALDSNRLHHAYLFTGTRGVGKTTLGRILAKCFNCEKGVGSSPCGTCSACTGIDEGRFVDLIEVDAASRSKVDETRELMDNVQYAPTAARFKVYLIDEVHMFSGHSFNALLKTLEEPPPHVKFLLATTEPKKVPVTILSRCLQFNLKHLTAEQIGGQLGAIVGKESIETDEESVKLIAEAASGSMRDALSLLDQAVAFGGGKLEAPQVREMLGTIDSTELTGLLRALAAGDGAQLLERADRIAEHNPDYDAILANILALLHDVAVAQALPGSRDALEAAAVELVDLLPREDVQLYYQIALNGRRDLQFAPEARVAFEMTLVRMHAFRPLEAGGAAPAAPPQASRGTKSPASPPRAVTAGSSDWPTLIGELGLDGLTRTLAEHCHLKERTPQKLHLILAPAQEHFLKTNQKDRLQQAVRDRLGADVKLVISVEEPPAETPSEQRAREQRERQEAAVQSLESDPNVQTMKEMFDATLDRNSVRPRQQ
jgi:DNA polymerase-3 subunit gamma/tau